MDDDLVVRGEEDFEKAAMEYNRLREKAKRQYIEYCHFVSRSQAADDNVRFHHYYHKAKDAWLRWEETIQNALQLEMQLEAFGVGIDPPESVQFEDDDFDGDLTQFNSGYGLFGGSSD